MITRVCRKDFIRIINSFTPEEIWLKYGKLVIKEEYEIRDKEIRNAMNKEIDRTDKMINKYCGISKLYS
jgi:hypothetical protein